MKVLLILLILIILPSCKNISDEDYLWLEDIESQSALDWVRNQNKLTVERFTGSKRFTSIQSEMVALMSDKKKIPYPRIRGDYVYNFWRDEQNIKGIWRRSLKSKYINDEPEWEVLLNLDKLSRDENKSWVFKGVIMQSSVSNRCLIRLSPGGSDASELREFDLENRKFVKGGFFIPVNKVRVTWLDKDTLILGTTLKKEDRTSSGYPRNVKVWKRGTPLKEAKTVFSGEKSDVSVGAYKLDQDANLFIVYRSVTFYKSESFLWQNGNPFKLNIPDDCRIEGYLNDELFLELKSPWKGFATGSLISLNFERLLANQYEISSVFTPDANTSYEDFSYTENEAYITVIRDVKSQLYKVEKKNSEWQKKLVQLPENGRLSVITASDKSDDLFISFSSFLKPSTLFLLSDGELAEYKTLKEKFDASPYVTEQLFVRSKDGTRIPYFVVRKKDMKFDGTSPVLLSAYGGFQISRKPYYSSFTGRFWLDQGGVFVLANVRGGGEYGPKWHQAAIKLNKHKSYEDFIAVSEDLINRKITSKEKLAIKGGSNGGLLMGVMLTQRPDLFKAIICKVPLLDMLRFHKLLAGASWMGEYGNPDDEEDREYLMSYSPFHNLKKWHNYPEILFTTSTKDDRVHPGHARKMAKKMIDLGYKIHYYENIEGGHGGAADLQQIAMMNALEYMYLYEKLEMK